MTTSYEVAAIFLPLIGAPVTADMQRAWSIWSRFESGTRIIGNNPLNLHAGRACPADIGYCEGGVYAPLPGQLGNRSADPETDANVAVFATIEDALRAYARNLSQSAYGYPRVLRKAKAGDARGFLEAVQLSSWSAGHYAPNKLLKAWDGGGSYNDTLTFEMPVAKGELEHMDIAATKYLHLTIPAGKRKYDLRGNPVGNPLGTTKTNVPSLYLTKIGAVTYYAVGLGTTKTLYLVRADDVTAEDRLFAAEIEATKAKVTADATARAIRAAAKGTDTP